MHELSIAMSIIDVAAAEAQRLDARVAAVHLRLGPLSGVVKEALLSSWDLARENSPLADARLVIEQTPIIAWCSKCGAEKEIASIQRLCCPECGTPTPEARCGRELEVSALEIFEDSSASTK
ncbi:MAG TPA: hydrogenase maturation nickel metallochaperone HypA [Tepidisphaeraceae bacterium]|nr:hydrogenase maturation nickel metallochaperone HypA [Tepidisphaeraceae bacterium]